MMDSDEFKRVVKDVSGAVNGLSDCVIAKCSSGMFSLSSSSPTGLNIKSECKAEMNDFSFAVSHRRMSEIAKRVSGEITFKDGEIRCGRSKFKIKAIDPKLYHDPDSTEFDTSFIVEAEALREILNKSALFCDKSNVKPVFTGVEISGGNLSACATNSQKLAVCVTKMKVPDFKAIIPHSSILSILSCVGPSYIVEIGNCIRFTCGLKQVTTSKVDGLMPDIQKLLDSIEGVNYKVDKQGMMDAVDTAQSLAEKSFNQVKVIGKDGVITVSATNGESLSMVDYIGDNFSAAFNADMLLQCISSCDNEVLNVTQGSLMRIKDELNTFCLAGVRI